MLQNQETDVENVGMTSDEMKNDLQISLEDINSRNDALNSQEQLNKNNIREMKTKTIQYLFSLLEEYGVDASDLRSINEFLTKLNAQDPDLANLFEIAFTDLTSDVENEQKQTEEGEYNNAGTMNQFRNLSKNIMQPR